MASWNDGYVIDIGYSANVYREFTPTWLSLASLLMGHRPPDLAGPYTMAELGCGYGMTLMAAAATAPHAAFWGFDFNPTHIEVAARLARRAGLDNLTFAERSMAELAAAPADALPAFDIIALHGVWSWISEAARRDALRFIATRLKPGGLVYVSYNVLTGWSPMLPVRTLMRLIAERAGRTERAVPAIRSFLGQLRQGSPGYFAAHPTLEKRLQGLADLDARYLAHEYLNADWQPVMFADMAAMMAEARCQYIGSATLTDNVDVTSVPPTLRPLLVDQPDPVLRETVRDFGNGQSFRRDIYRRGVNPLAVAEHRALLEGLTFVAMDRPREAEMKVPTSIGELSGNKEIYDPLLDLLAGGSLTLAQAMAAPGFADRPVSELMQALTLLTAGGYMHPAAPAGDSAAARAAARRANLEIVDMNAGGANITQLVAPAIGSTLHTDVTEGLVLGGLLEAAGEAADPAADPASRPVPDPAEQVQRLAALLARGGRGLTVHGVAPRTPEEALAACAEIVRVVNEDRAPLHRRLGIRPLGIRPQ